MIRNLFHISASMKITVTMMIALVFNAQFRDLFSSFIRSPCMHKTANNNLFNSKASARHESDIASAVGFNA